MQTRALFVYNVTARACGCAQLCVSCLIYLRLKMVLWRKINVNTASYVLREYTDRTNHITSYISKEIRAWMHLNRSPAVSSLPSEPYRYQNVTCKLYWSLIGRRESSLLRHWTCDTRPSSTARPARFKSVQPARDQTLHLIEQTQLFNQEMAFSWSVEEVQTFLSLLIAEERIQQELDGATRNEKGFLEVAKLLAAHGYRRTYKQCRDKLKQLKSDYRSIKDHNSQSGSNRRSWKWFDQMDAIYGGRPTSIGREGALDSATPMLENTIADGTLNIML